MTNLGASSLAELPKTVNQPGQGMAANGVEDETAAFLTTLASIIGPPTTARSIHTSILIIIEALIRARDRAVPAGTSTRDAQLAHDRLVDLLRRVSQLERGQSR